MGVVPVLGVVHANDVPIVTISIRSSFRRKSYDNGYLLRNYSGSIGGIVVFCSYISRFKVDVLSISSFDSIASVVASAVSSRVESVIELSKDVLNLCER